MVRLTDLGGLSLPRKSVGGLIDLVAGLSLPGNSVVRFTDIGGLSLPRNR